MVYKSRIPEGEPYKTSLVIGRNDRVKIRNPLAVMSVKKGEKIEPLA